MKKILIFASYFYPHKGGAEKYIYELYRRLIKDKNFEVDIFTNNTENVSEFEKIEGLNVYRVPCYHILGKTYPVPKPLASFKLLRKLKKNKYGFVNTQTRFWISSFYGYLFSKFTNTKLIHTEHGTRHTEFDNPIIKKLAEIYDHVFGTLIIKSAWKNIGISKASCEFSKHLGAQLTYLILNGVDTSVFKKKKTDLKRRLGIHKDYKIITYVGRLIYAKGVQDLISIFPSIKEKYPKSKLLIVGDGDYKNELEKLKNGDEDIIFLGQRDDVVDILNITDVFVNPSYSEGMPTTILEASSVGISIVATNVGGTKEIIDSTYQVSPGKIEDLLQKILKSLYEKTDNSNLVFDIKDSSLALLEIFK